MVASLFIGNWFLEMQRDKTQKKMCKIREHSFPRKMSSTNLFDGLKNENTFLAFFFPVLKRECTEIVLRSGSQSVFTVSSLNNSIRTMNVSGSNHAFMGPTTRQQRDLGNKTNEIIILILPKGK